MGDNKLHLLKLVNVHYLTNISRRRAHKTEIILELCYNAHVTYRPIKRTLYTKLSTFIGSARFFYSILCTIMETVSLNQPLAQFSLVVAMSVCVSTCLFVPSQ